MDLEYLKAKLIYANKPQHEERERERQMYVCVCVCRWAGVLGGAGFDCASKSSASERKCRRVYAPIM